MAGTITTNAVVLGDSATAANNFQLRSNTDGSMKLARGATGALGDILTVNASGQVTLNQGFAAVPAQAGTVSMVRLNTANGYGAVNTQIRRFTTTVTNQGSDITYADSANNGASFTINTNGVYSVSFTDQFTAGATTGLSLNSSQLTTPIISINASDILGACTTAASGNPSLVSWTGYLAAGAVVRPHNNGGTTGGNPNAVQFTIVRVA